MALAFFKRHYTAKFEVPNVDLSGRTCLITGTTVGSLGYEGALHFARKNPARLILTCRNQAKGDDTIAAIRSTVPSYKGILECWNLDMSSFDSVRAFSDRLDGLDRLDAIILNAGVYHEAWVETNEGFENTLQINVIATGLLALRALPVLGRTANLPGDKSIKPHLAIVSSDLHIFAKFPQQKEPNIIAALNVEEKAVHKETYNTSKLLDLFIAREMAKLPAASKVIVTAVNPGLCKSDFRGDMPKAAAAFWNWLAWPTEFGTRNFLYACIADEMAPSSFVTSTKGAKIQKQIFAELSIIWQQLDPKVQALLA